MKTEFIPYELALKMKQLGYKKEGVDEECFAFYDEEEYLFTVREQDDIDEEWLIAPTFSQAFRWFREKHGAVCEIIRKEDCNHSEFIGWVYIDDKKIDVISYWNSKKYEEAEHACLEKLIEIINEK
jgi:hypothetical protein